MNTDPRPNGSASGIEHDRFWSGAPWAPFVVPFVVYGLIGSFEPSNPPEPNLLGITVASEHYPLIYTVKLAATIAALVLFWPAYVAGAGFAFRVAPLAIAVGLVGGVLWIALCYVPLVPVFSPVGLGDWFDTSDRPGFNPFVELAGNPAWTYGFLAIRFIGLALVVPLMEELFLRAFLMRFVMHANWRQIPFGEVSGLAIAVGTLVPMLTHPPSELLAVAVWFSLVTWLMVRTRNFWDCVVAHAVTNLMLGIYLVAFKQWWLW
jgi:CAAX prenyl protease-like protein